MDGSQESPKIICRRAVCEYYILTNRFLIPKCLPILPEAIKMYSRSLKNSSLKTIITTFNCREMNKSKEDIARELEAPKRADHAL